MARISKWILNDFWLGLIIGLILGSQAIFCIMKESSVLLGFKAYPVEPRVRAIFRPKLGQWLNVTWYDWYIPVEMK